MVASRKKAGPPKAGASSRKKKKPTGQKAMPSSSVSFAAPVRLPGIPLGEIGTTGLRQLNGFIEQAYHKSLFWPEVYGEYSRLRRSMPEMGMVRQLFTTLGRSVTPSVELPEHPTDDDKRYRDFVESEFDNIEGGFNQFMETMVNQVPFMGWGRWNVVPGIRDPKWKPPQAGDEWHSEEDDGLIGIRRLAWRDQGTLDHWEFDQHKRMIGMWQRDYPMIWPLEYLPNSKCLHLTFGDPINPEGLSPLEAIWRLERIRYGFEVILGIGFEHAAGYLDVTKTEGGTLTPEDVRNIERAALNVLTAKEGNYAAWPPGIAAKIQDVTFQASSSLLNAIGHYSILCLSVYLAQFIAYNTIAGVGSYASSSDSSQMAIMAFNSMMDGFASQVDQQIGRKWWEWNKEEFPGVTERPQIKFSHVQKGVELGVLGQFIGQIKDTIPLGEEDLVAIRDKSGFLPTTLPEEEDVINPQSLPPSDQGDPSLTLDGDETGQGFPEEEAWDQAPSVLREALRVYSQTGGGNGKKAITYEV